MATRKIGPAIAAGCTMVWKPAEQTPLTALAFARLLEEADLPAGVLNLVTTSQPGPLVTALLGDPRLRKLSFTGSVEVGCQLAAAAARQMLRISMELGGNAPFIVFEDADLEAAVEGALVAKMRNCGEACTAANRFLVAEPVAQEFANLLAQRMGSLQIGRGTEPTAEVGPLIDSAALSKVERLVQDALERGARCLTGGRRVQRPGYFFEPTVLLDVAPDAGLLSEEIFGPVAPVTSFADKEEALEMANSTDTGLVAYVYTNRLDRAIEMCERLEFGMVGLNRGMVSNAAAPFGGWKKSGVGREGGPEGLESYLETKYVAVGV